MPSSAAEAYINNNPRMVQDYLESSMPTVAIIGAGPVGALAAIYFAQSNYAVHLYELRSDPRLPENQLNNFSKSINLALSDRGIEGLKGADKEFARKIMSDVIPMHGRMIHDRKGKQESQLYDIHGRHINAVDRGWLNEELLTKAESFPNVHVHFKHKLLRCDWESNTYHLRDTASNEDVSIKADLLVGADGAHSVVRNQMMRRIPISFSQHYIDSTWCELTIPPVFPTFSASLSTSLQTQTPPAPNFALNPNRLHIWPRQTFMLIALPNTDRSFTCTLFMPQVMFDALTTPAELLAFFEKEFPDAVGYIGKDRLVHEFFRNPKEPLVSIKASTHVLPGRAVILGDAAHAMVPFYGQGMNAGFEDVRILHEHLRANPGDIPTALAAYDKERVKDAHAICDLALHNYEEMRAGVTSRTYLLRKKTEEWFYANVPALGIRTLYTMVSFDPAVPYSAALRHAELQGTWFKWVGALVSLGAVGALVTTARVVSRMMGWVDRVDRYGPIAPGRVWRMGVGVANDIWRRWG
ncbi:kynurenine 3-monooxygenase, mitochondrial precursor [Saitoella coloradoensis]